MADMKMKDHINNCREGSGNSRFFNGHQQCRKIFQRTMLLQYNNYW